MCLTLLQSGVSAGLLEEKKNGLFDFYNDSKEDKTKDDRTEAWVIIQKYSKLEVSIIPSRTMIASLQGECHSPPFATRAARLLA